MRYVAAYLLAVLGGKSQPSKEDITNILESIGLDVEDDKLSKVVSELEGKDLGEVIQDGMGKLGSLPAAVPAGGLAAAGGEGKAEESKEEEKKEEKKEESEEESDDDMGFGLFD